MTRLATMPRSLAVVLALAVVCWFGSSALVGTSGQPVANTGYGQTVALVWGPGAESQVGYNPLNTPGASTSGVGGSTGSCLNTGVQASYSMTVLENYQQLITFFPLACTNLRVRITYPPDSTTGVLYQYSRAAGRSFPVTAAGTELASNMALFQPALNTFSVFDYPRTPAINAALTTIVFQIYDTGLTTALPSTVTSFGGALGATLDFWLLWQNQAPSTADVAVTTDTGATSYDNQVIPLAVTDPDNTPPAPFTSNGLNQVLTAYIATLPAAGALYQYDAAATLYQGAAITAAGTMVTDSLFRVVLAVGGTGRPYATFTYTADDTLVDSLAVGTVTLNVLVSDTPVANSGDASVDMNGVVKVQLNATSAASTQSLNRATIVSLPQRGSLYQLLADGSVGQRVQLVPTTVADSTRLIYFKPDPYTSDSTSYATFDFTINNGLTTSVSSATITMHVNPIHIAPFASPPASAISIAGNDVAVRFIGSTLQPGNPALTAIITGMPALGTLRQSNGDPISNITGPWPCPVNDTQFLTVIYTPLQNLANPSIVKRYTETFTYVITDGVVQSLSATATIQVGSVIRPPLVYSQTYSTLQNTTIIIQLNGTVQDSGDTWTPFITRIPTSGQLYQMTNGQKGAAITGTAATPVADSNYYVFFVPDRFSPLNVSFDFVGQNSEGVQSATTATALVLVGYVGYAPTVPTTGSVTTAASTAVTYACTFYAGPTAPASVQVFITTAPAAGTLYQYNATTGLRMGTITAAAVASQQALGYPGVRITDLVSFSVLFDPPPYVHGPAAQNYAYAQFIYSAQDGILSSPTPSTVTIAVTQVNFPPIVSDASVVTPQETAITIYLSSYVVNPSAADGNTYVCIISSLPTSGSLYQVDATGKAASAPIPVPNVIVSDSQTRVIYKPKSGTGQYGSPYDAFKFFAQDTEHSIKSIRFATVSVNVTFVNKPPTAPALSALMYENQAKVITLAAVDPEGAALTTYITSSNLPYGRLFQYVSSGGGLPASLVANYSVGGVVDVDPEYGLGYTLSNYTGLYGGGFDYSRYIGAPLVVPSFVTDPSNRVVFVPLVYTHGNAAYDYIYGLAAYATSGTFSYVGNDGLDNSTTAGAVSVKVKTVVYAPLAYTQTFEMDEDGLLVITLPIHAFDVDEAPPCYIISIPTIGDLYQYDGRNALSPKAEQILSRQTQVQDINADGTPGSGRQVVYVPPKLQYGVKFANFSFYATNSKDSNPGMVYITVNKINHAPTAASFSVILSGHNSTVPVVFNVSDVDYNPVFINITSFPTRGRLWARSTYVPDPSTSGFSTYTPTAGSAIVPGSSFYYPSVTAYNASNTTAQSFQILFDDFNMGGAAVTTGCVVTGTEVPCGYSSFTFRVLDAAGAYNDAFVEVQIQCGPSYVINTWQTVGAACVVCPTGAICASEGQFLPMAEEGYWRGITSTGLMFVACLPASACLGSNTSAAVTDLDSQCAAGYHGRMCAACSDRYYKLNDSCMPCTTTSVFWVVLAGVPSAILLMWFILHVSRRGVDLTFFAIVLTYCQILAVYSQYHLTWPDSVLTTLTVLSISHLNLDIFAVSCYYNTGEYSDKWKAKMAVIPGMALAVVAMVAVLMAMRATCGKHLVKLEQNRRAKRKEAGEEDADDVTGHAAVANAQAASAMPALNRLISSGMATHAKAAQDRLAAERDLALVETRFLVNNDPSAGFDENTPLRTWFAYYVSLGMRTFTLLLFVAYLPICVKVFQLFSCTPFADGTSTFDADWSLTCYSSWWNQLEPWGIVAIIFYGIGVPVWFAFGLYKTAPKFDWVKYWAIVYYPQVRAANDPRSRAEAQKGSSVAAETTGSFKKQTSFKKPPPPPNSPPEIPAPHKGTAKDLSARGAKVPHLHAATVHALEQARAGQTEEDASARRARLEEDDATQQAKKEAAWAISENLALTSAESTTLTQQQKIARFMFTLVIDPFRDALFFWMFVILFRSFLLAMVSIFFADEPVYQATLALLVLFLYTLATAFFQPYVNPAMNRLEFITMSCSCLILFSGFLFVGESDKTAWVFNLLAGICLAILLASFLFIAKVVFIKLEEVFHCWNCRRVPNIAAPPSSDINSLAKTMRADIIAGHAEAPAPPRKSAPVSALGVPAPVSTAVSPSPIVATPASASTPSSASGSGSSTPALGGGATKQLIGSVRPLGNSARDSASPSRSPATTSSARAKALGSPMLGGASSLSPQNQTTGLLASNAKPSDAALPGDKSASRSSSAVSRGVKLPPTSPAGVTIGASASASTGSSARLAPLPVALPRTLRIEDAQLAPASSDSPQSDQVEGIASPSAVKQ